MANARRNKDNKLIKIGVDLGTANLLVYVDGEGIIFNEPSVIAMEYETNEVIAVGYNAAKMIGRGHHGIKIVSPLNQGVISDMDAAKKLIEIAVRKGEAIDVNLNATTDTLTINLTNAALVDTPVEGADTIVVFDSSFYQTCCQIAHSSFRSVNHYQFIGTIFRMKTFKTR